MIINDHYYEQAQFSTYMHIYIPVVYRSIRFEIECHPQIHMRIDSPPAKKPIGLSFYCNILVSPIKDSCDNVWDGVSMAGPRKLFHVFTTQNWMHSLSAQHICVCVWTKCFAVHCFYSWKSCRGFDCMPTWERRILQRTKEHGRIGPWNAHIPSYS